MNDTGPEVSGSPASHPPTAGPHRRPASVARRISAGASRTLRSVAVATAPTVSQAGGPAHYLA